MELVYSKLAPKSRHRKKKREASSFIQKIEYRMFSRAKAEVLAEFANEIAEIQKSIPGWEPVVTMHKIERPGLHSRPIKR